MIVHSCNTFTGPSTVQLLEKISMEDRVLITTVDMLAAFNVHASQIVLYKFTEIREPIRGEQLLCRAPQPRLMR